MSIHEECLIGAALSDPGIHRTVTVTGDQFDDGRLGAVWDALADLREVVEQPPIMTVVAHCATQGFRVDPNVLVELVGTGCTADAPWYAHHITTDAHRRAITTKINQARTRLDDPDTTVDTVLADLTRATSTTANSDRTWTLDEFVDQDIPPANWIIPGLFEKGDRLILTGEEGLGKSTLLRQLAICAAVGWDPFEGYEIPTQRVLYIDAENPEGIMIKRLRDIRDALAERGRFAGHQFRLSCHPGGLDLTSSRDRQTVHSLCRRHQPDLLVIGPIYKLYTGGSNQREEDMARAVADAIDQIRVDFGVGVMLEHHAGHAAAGQKRAMRPIGSSLWLRWPEFGLGLAGSDNAPPSNGMQLHRRRYADLRPWRGSRDDRPWPTALESGNPGSLPWFDLNPPATRRYRP